MFGDMVDTFSFFFLPQVNGSDEVGSEVASKGSVIIVSSDSDVFAAE